jgi:hypothetical protein
MNVNKFRKKLKVCNFKKNIKYLEMEKYNQIQEEIRNLQHQEEYLEKGKTSSTVSWKNCQYRKKLIHKRKSTIYRIP